MASDIAPDMATGATPRSDGVTVLIPTLLRPLIGDRSSVQVETPAVLALADLLNELHRGYPVFARRIRDETGALRRYVNVYVDGEDVRRLAGLATPVPPGAEVMIVQSVAGG